MKVRELIKMLEACPEDWEVMYDIEDTCLMERVDDDEYEEILDTDGTVDGVVCGRKDRAGVVFLKEGIE